MRFEPGEEKPVTLVAFGACAESSDIRAKSTEHYEPASLTARAYADFYGPTTGDRVRLADTP